MAVSRIGLATTTTGWYNTDEIKINQNIGYSNLYVGWCTQYDHASAGDKFEIAVRYRGISKGAPPILPNWSNWTTVTVNASNCNEHFNDYYADYWYAYNISNFGIPGLSRGVDMYSGMFDYLEIQISVAVRYATPQAFLNGGTYMAPIQASTSITWLPIYSLELMKSENLNEICLQVYPTEGMRNDDRWNISLIRPSNSWNNLLKSNVWGTVRNGNRFYIDRKYFKEQPVDGQTYIINGYMNRYWKPIGDEQVGIVGTVLYDNSPQCNTPTCTIVTNSIDKLVVRIGDSGDKGHPIDRVRITLEGSSYSCDTSAGDIGLHTLPAQPFGTSTYEIHAWSDTYGISESIYITNTVKPDGNFCYFNTAPTLEGIEGIGCKVQHNPQYSVSMSAEKETYKFAGRDNPTAFFGVGKTNTVTVSGTLIDDPADKWLAIAASNTPVFVRFGDGKRYQCAVDSMDVNWNFRPLKSVSFSGTEVD